MQCSNCLYTSLHPLNLTFNENGVCSGCIIHKEKDTIDWNERWAKLVRLTGRYKSQSRKNYDCIIPVSGARDSYFIVHTVKHLLGLNPLLVCYNKHYNTDIGVRNLANLRIKLDCDILIETINPDTVKRITRETLRRFGSLYWHCLAGETVFPVKTAVRLKIPLIIWGAHQGVDQVGMFSHLDEVEMTRKYRKEHDLMGFEAEDLDGEMENLTTDHLSPFYYPDDYLLQRVGVRGIYLNNYLRWDSKEQHEKMIKLYNYETRKMGRSFDYYNDVDSYVYLELHDYIKSLKTGYSKVTDHACREIRLGRMNKKRASFLAAYYSKIEPKFTDLFVNWLGTTSTGLNFVLDQHRNPKIWHRNDDWTWEKSDSFQSDQLFDSMEVLDADEGFIRTPVYASSDSSEQYVLHGHGYAHNREDNC